MSGKLYFVAVAVFTSVYSQSDVRLPPNVIIPYAPKVVYKNYKDGFSLPCQAKGIPEPSYEWLRGGIPLIASPQITFDSVKGDITFTDFTTREEGVFTCVARSMFDSTIVKSFAPTYTLKQSRIDEFRTNATISVVADEYSYIKLNCANKGEAVGEEIRYDWYDVNGTQIKIDDRQFIDQNGNLHYAYVTTADGNVRKYRCGISATGLSYVQLGGVVVLSINTIASPTAIAPQVQYTNSRTKFIRFSTATLECFFSGYDPQYPYVLVTKWYFDDDKEINATGRYSFSADHRRLLIYNADEPDEKNYYCQAQNTRGISKKEAVFLDITSSPIFYPNGAPVDQTMSEGKDAVFNCNARSARGETEPDPPVWYINGQQVGSQTDKTKFVFSDGNKKLTIRSLKKATDIMCIQCSVSNPVGTTWADGCLNVLLPILILRQPPSTQNIDYGDKIDLTVTAITDPSQNLTYRWKHNNTDFPNVPPFVVYNSTTREAYINTSNLNIDQYESVRGTYIINVTHNFDYIVVEMNVVLRDKPDLDAPNANAPQLLYTNSNTTFLRFSTATLECYFSGYNDPQYPDDPVTKWYFDDGNEIKETSRYSFSDDHRLLIIYNVVETDEKKYYCQAQNTRGTSNKEAVFLDITSSPIFYPNGAPVDQTMSEGKDAVFNCNARSARGETEPDPPVWYINGEQVGAQTDQTKFILSDGNRTLTVKSVKKASDIMCIQCSVSNLVGTTWGEGCLNVLSINGAEWLGIGTASIMACLALLGTVQTWNTD